MVESCVLPVRFAVTSAAGGAEAAPVNILLHMATVAIAGSLVDVQAAGMAGAALDGGMCLSQAEPRIAFVVESERLP